MFLDIIKRESYLLIVSENIGSSNYLNKLRLSIKKNGQRFSKQTQTSYLTEIFAVVAR